MLALAPEYYQRIRHGHAQEAPSGCARVGLSQASEFWWTWSKPTSWSGRHLPVCIPEKSVTGSGTPTKPCFWPCLARCSSGCGVMAVISRGMDSDSVDSPVLFLSSPDTSRTATFSPWWCGFIASNAPVQSQPLKGEACEDLLGVSKEQSCWILPTVPFHVGCILLPMIEVPHITIPLSKNCTQLCSYSHVLSVANSIHFCFCSKQVSQKDLSDGFDVCYSSTSSSQAIITVLSWLIECKWQSRTEIGLRRRSRKEPKYGTHTIISLRVAFKKFQC